MARTVIYTAIYGEFDHLRRQPVFPGVDYVCFSDQRLSHPTWQVITRPPRYEDPRLAAKYFKMMPHRVLWQYSRSIWIDGSIQITSPDFVAHCMGFLREKAIALFEHPVRGDIASEADVLAAIPKWSSLPFHEQVRHYRDQGYPDDRLYACTLLVRRHRRREMRRLGAAWLAENVRWTFRDQLSFPYVAWVLGITPAVIPYDLWNNPLFELREHARDS